MADELDEKLNEPSESQQRITQLSKKAKEEAEAREVAQKAAADAEAKVQEAQRERDFFASFSDVVATNPSAREHRDDILAKVKGGYTMQDATIAVLHAAGKLAQPEVQSQQVIGGSASITPPSSTQKGVGEMTQAERREALASLSDAELITAMRQTNLP